MTRMTLQEFKTVADASYPIRISQRKGVVSAFMIEFSEPDFLGGPFHEKYGLITIVDHRLIKYPKPLLTETETFNRHREYLISRSRNFPRTLKESAGIPNDQEIISGKHHSMTLEPVSGEISAHFKSFSTANTLPNSETLKHPFLVSRMYEQSSLDVSDMIKLMRVMLTAMPTDAALSTLDEVEKKIENEIAAYVKFEFGAVPTIEEPWTLTVHGNDDASYTKRFPNCESALAFADEIEMNSTADFVRNKMCFTN